MSKRGQPFSRTAVDLRRSAQVGRAIADFSEATDTAFGLVDDTAEAGLIDHPLVTRLIAEAFSVRDRAWRRLRRATYARRRVDALLDGRC